MCRSNCTLVQNKQITCINEGKEVNYIVCNLIIINSLVRCISVSCHHECIILNSEETNDLTTIKPHTCITLYNIQGMGYSCNYNRKQDVLTGLMQFFLHISSIRCLYFFCHLIRFYLFNNESV